MRLLVMGTGSFAVPMFEWLLASPHGVAALVTRPILERKRRPPASPMRLAGEAHRLPILEPASVNAAEAIAELKELKADLAVVCDYGQILSAECLSIFPLGGVNLHGSLLPKYRGAAPVQWAVYRGESETGASVLHMTPRLDAGPVLARRKTPIGERETAAELEPRLAHLGVDAIRESLEMLASWDGQSEIGERQDPSQATRAPRLKKSDGEVDWTQPAAQIERQVRAFTPWPATFTHWLREGAAPMRLILNSVAVVERDGPPGRLLECGSEDLIVACGEAALRIERLQPAGKQPMPAAAFLRGHDLKPSHRFGRS